MFRKLSRRRPGRLFQLAEVPPGPPPASSSVGAEEALLEAEKICRGMSLYGWELYLEEERQLTIESRDLKIESLVSAKSRGFSVRVLRRGRMGSSYTNNLSTQSLQAAVERAATAADYYSPDEAYGFCRPGDYQSLSIHDNGVAARPEAEKIALAIRLEEMALAADPDVKKVRGAEYEEIDSRVWIRNSEGVRASAETTLISAGLEAIAEKDGNAESAGEVETEHFYDRLDVARVAQTAARNAASLLGGEPSPGGKKPAVFSAEAAAGLLSLVASAACGDSVMKERSWLRGRLGQRIGSALVTLIDDGTEQGGPGAFPFDDEGTPSRRTVAVENGILKAFLYDEYYGRRSGTGSTSNGIRPSYFLPPSVDITNWLLLPGAGGEQDLISQIDDGFYIMELMGLHTADPVTGEFSVGFSGFRIEKGRKSGPVTGMAAAGTIEEMLNRVAAVGGELKWGSDAGSPPILVECVDVSGQE